jgi:ligand-binding sensor domain-containing protein
LGDNDVLSLCLLIEVELFGQGHILVQELTKIQPNNAKFNLIKHDSRSKNSLNDNVVWSIYKDKENILWIGTYKGGINRIDTKSNNFSSISTKDLESNSISSNHIRVIKEDNYGNLWVGTYDGGLNIINKKSNQVKYLQKFY